MRRWKIRQRILGDWKTVGFVCANTDREAEKKAKRQGANKSAYATHR